MKILVTGGAGFIGSHIADSYLAAGHEVVIIDNLATGNQQNLNSRAKFYNVDIRDQKIGRIFEQERFEIVCHHAAQINVRESIKNPVFDAEINILGSLNIFENCVRQKVKKIIFASSGGAVYGEPKYLPADEKHPVSPLSPYAISKYAVENYLYAYGNNYGLNYTILRYANVYGPRQDPKGEAGVIAIFIDKMKRNQVPAINGDGQQLRDYVYVADVVEANVLVLTKGDRQIFNLGTAKGISVNTLFSELKQLLSYQGEVRYGPPIAGEIIKTYLNADKAKVELGWKPGFGISAGLRKTLEAL